MRRQKLEELYKKLETAVHEAERIAKATKDAANELSHGALSSPSSSGDREHATNAAYLNQQKLVKLVALRNEVGEAVEKEIPNKIESVCYFNNHYLVSRPMYINGFSLISSDSPLGKAAIGKQAGQKYKYKNAEGKTIVGIIATIG